MPVAVRNARVARRRGGCRRRPKNQISRPKIVARAGERRRAIRQGVFQVGEASAREYTQALAPHVRIARPIVFSTIASMSVPTVVLLPGLDGTGDLLDPFSAAAPPGVDCLILRYPTDRRLDYRELEDFVIARVPPGGRLVLVGESFSGPVAVRVAVRLGERVAHLILCNSFLTPPRLPLLRYCARTAVFRIRLPERILAALMLAPRSTPALASAFAAALGKVAPFVLAHRIRQVLSVHDLPALQQLGVPVTYLRGTWDRLVPDRALRHITQAVPAVRVHHIEAPHALLQTAPAAAWAHIGAAIETAT
jgi:pimeloyl-[acyl-carrier protein] methyl ester esterase